MRNFSLDRLAYTIIGLTISFQTKLSKATSSPKLVSRVVFLICCQRDSVQLRYYHTKWTLASCVEACGSRELNGQIFYDSAQPGPSWFRPAFFFSQISAIDRNVFEMTEINLAISVKMSENIGWWTLLRRVLINLWDKRPKCFSDHTASAATKWPKYLSEKKTGSDPVQNTARSVWTFKPSPTQLVQQSGPDRPA